MRIVHVVACGAALGAVFSVRASPPIGRIVVANDEWTLGTRGFVPPSDGDVFAANIATWFARGGTGSFLAWNHYAFTDPQLAAAVTGAGHAWTVAPPGPLTLEVLQQHDGVFLAAASVPSQVLIDYVEGGGNVYIAAGTGAWGSAALEASAWNPFLEHFGLRLHAEWSTSTGTHLPVSEAHSVFVGVDHLWHDFGQGVIDLQPLNPANRAFLPVPGHSAQGHYGVFDGLYCATDCNGDGQLNLADFGCFQTRFALASPWADCNGDGVLNLADFGCYQTRFALGCQ